MFQYGITELSYTEFLKTNVFIQILLKLELAGKLYLSGSGQTVFMHTARENGKDCWRENDLYYQRF